LILVGCGVVITFNLHNILKDVRSITQDTAEAASDLAALKEGIKVMVINLVQKGLEKMKGGKIKDDE
jgi:hypothetical protein